MPIHAFEQSTGRVYGWPEMGVTSLRDLKGQKVAVARETAAHIHLDLALRSAGMTVSDSTVLNMDTASATAAFIGRSVPATVADSFVPATGSPAGVNVVREQ